MPKKKKKLLNGKKKRKASVLGPVEESARKKARKESNSDSGSSSADFNEENKSLFEAAMVVPAQKKKTSAISKSVYYRQTPFKAAEILGRQLLLAKSNDECKDILEDFLHFFKKTKQINVGSLEDVLNAFDETLIKLFSEMKWEIVSTFNDFLSRFFKELGLQIDLEIINLMTFDKMMQPDNISVEMLLSYSEAVTISSKGHYIKGFAFVDFDFWIETLADLVYDNSKLQKVKLLLKMYSDLITDEFLRKLLQEKTTNYPPGSFVKLFTLFFSMSTLASDIKRKNQLFYLALQKGTDGCLIAALDNLGCKPPDNVNAYYLATIYGGVGEFEKYKNLCETLKAQDENFLNNKFFVEHNPLVKLVTGEHDISEKTMFYILEHQRILFVRVSPQVKRSLCFRLWRDCYEHSYAQAIFEKVQGFDGFDPVILLTCDPSSINKAGQTMQPYLEMLVAATKDINSLFAFLIKNFFENVNEFGPSFLKTGYPALKFAFELLLTKNSKVEPGMIFQHFLNLFTTLDARKFKRGSSLTKNKFARFKELCSDVLQTKKMESKAAFELIAQWCSGFKVESYDTSIDALDLLLTTFDVDLKSEIFARKILISLYEGYHERRSGNGLAYKFTYPQGKIVARHIPAEQSNEKLELALLNHLLQRNLDITLKFKYNDEDCRFFDMVAFGQFQHKMYAEHERFFSENEKFRSLMSDAKHRLQIKMLRDRIKTTGIWYKEKQSVHNALIHITAAESATNLIKRHLPPSLELAQKQKLIKAAEEEFAQHLIKQMLPKASKMLTIPNKYSENKKAEILKEYSFLEYAIHDKDFLKNELLPETNSRLLEIPEFLAWCWYKLTYEKFKDVREEISQVSLTELLAVAWVSIKNSKDPKDVPRYTHELIINVGKEQIEYRDDEEYPEDQKASCFFGSFVGILTTFDVTTFDGKTLDKSKQHEDVRLIDVGANRLIYVIRDFYEIKFSKLSSIEKNEMFEQIDDDLVLPKSFIERFRREFYETPDLPIATALEKYPPIKKQIDDYLELPWPLDKFSEIEKYKLQLPEKPVIPEEIMVPSVSPPPVSMDLSDDELNRNNTPQQPGFQATDQTGKLSICDTNSGKEAKRSQESTELKETKEAEEKRLADQDASLQDDVTMKAIDTILTPQEKEGQASMLAQFKLKTQKQTPKASTPEKTVWKEMSLGGGGSGSS